MVNFAIKKDFASFFYLYILIMSLLIGCIFIQGKAFAQTSQVIQTYFEDKTGKLSFEAVQKQKFGRFEENLNRGYSKSTFWIRLQYMPPANQTRLFLKAQTAFLDEICLYEPYHAMRCQGDTLPFKAREWKSMTPVFILTSQTLTKQVRQPITIYLSVRSTSSMLFQAEILTEKMLYDNDIHSILILGILSGIVFSLFVWGVYRIWVDRSLIAFLFTLYQLTLLLVVLTRSGYIAFYVLSDSNGNTDAFYHYLMLTIVLLLVILNRVFTAQFITSRWQKHALDILIFLLGVNFIAYELGYGRLESARNSALLGTISPVFVVWTLITVYKTKQAKRSLVLLYGTLLTLGGLFGLLRFDLIHLPYFDLQAVPHLAIVTLPLTFFLMYEKTSALRRKNQSLEIEIALSRQEIELERRQRVQQSAFMAMLTHELKSPLSVVSMALGSRKLRESGRISETSLKHVKKATQDMRHLIEQCVYVDKLLENNKELPFNYVHLDLILESIKASLIDNHRVHVQLMINDMHFYSSEIAMSVILTNLLDNGLKYSPAGSVVTLAITQAMQEEKAGLLVRVMNVIGEAGAPDLNLLFEKYYRASGAQRQRGTGLGLWLTRELAKRLEGTITCLVKDKHIQFELWLPFLVSHQEKQPYPQVA